MSYKELNAEIVEDERDGICIKFTLNYNNSHIVTMHNIANLRHLYLKIKSYLKGCNELPDEDGMFKEYPRSKPSKDGLYICRHTSVNGSEENIYYSVYSWFNDGEEFATNVLITHWKEFNTLEQ